MSPVIGENDSTLTISGITIQDPDLNVDPVRCLIFTKLKSLIFLNALKLSPLNFNCNGCIGSGVGATIMAFHGEEVLILCFILLHYYSVFNLFHRDFINNSTRCNDENFVHVHNIIYVYITIPFLLTCF